MNTSFLKCVAWWLPMCCCFYFSLSAQVQSSDTVLYIFFEKGKKSEIISKGKVKRYENLEYVKYERPDSGFHIYLERKILNPDSYYIGNTAFDGKTKDGYNRVPSKTIALRELRKYPVVTWEEVLAFVKTNYKERRVEEYAPDEVNTVPPPSDPLGSINFWSNIRHVYMVEKDKKKKVAILTEVTIRADEM